MKRKITLIFISIIFFHFYFINQLKAQTLIAETSRPSISTFIPGEDIKITFQISGLIANATDNLKVTIYDEHDALRTSQDLPVTADQDGKFNTEIQAPNIDYGYYKVTAKLSNGTELLKVGTRGAGYITYCIVPDPAPRILLGEKESRFGMQGGFSSQANIIPYLGVRWMLSPSMYNWGNLEPDHPGQFAEDREVALAKGQPYPSKVPEMENVTYNGKPWKTYMLATLATNRPPWAQVSDKFGNWSGAIKPESEGDWVNFCKEASKAFAENYPDREEQLFQITWEPSPLFNFDGTAQQLARIYELAYTALHKTVPNANVIGPTLFVDPVTWKGYHFNTLKQFVNVGGGKYLDGYSIHPYYEDVPPEKNYTDNPEQPALPQQLRRHKLLMDSAAGKQLSYFGTEQGINTIGDVSKDLDQAQRLIRENIIMLGEGYRFNFAFYSHDVTAGNLYYGYYYNLNTNIIWGSDKLSPKIVAPAYSFESFLLDGCRTKGAIENLGETVWGYNFQVRNQNVLALWDYGSSTSQVSIPINSSHADVYDWMGNKSSLQITNGKANVTLSNEVIYIVYTPEGPDLVVSGISLSPSQPSTNNQVSFSAVVKNQGSTATKAGDIIGLSFSIDGVPVNWSDTYNASLAPGSSILLTANSGPNSSATWQATGGLHTLEAWVDDINRISEVHEDNNKRDTSFSVSTITGIENKEINSINVFPQPVNEKLNIEIISASQQEVSIVLCDYLGKVRMTKKESLNENKNSISLGLQEIENGVYFLSIHFNEEIKWIKILVAK